MSSASLQSFKLEIGGKNRALFTADLRSAASLEMGDELVAHVLGKGVVLLETKEVIRDRVRANARGGSEIDGAALIRAGRIEDIEAAAKSWVRKDQLAAEAESRPQAESDAIGLEMLREIGL